MKKDNSDRQYLLMKPKALRFQGNLIMVSLGLDFLPSVILQLANMCLTRADRTRAKIFIP
jgi:hypothetical protein